MFDKLYISQTLAPFLLMSLLILPVVLWIILPPAILAWHGFAVHRQHRRVSKPLLLAALSVECFGVVLLTVLQLQA